jgi:serine/threonine-protein kinase
MLSEKKEWVFVPDLRGRDVVSAVGILERCKLDFEKAYKHHPYIPKDSVISQEPNSGRKVRVGEKIKLILSAGRPRVSVPQIVGKSLFSAKILLSQNGLATGKITFIYSDMPKNTILSYHPQAIEPKEGDRINILVSLGERPRSFIMPDLSGRRIREVTQIIKERGLCLNKVEVANGEDGVVLHQRPMPGLRVEEGTLVDLVVGFSR